MFVNPGGLLVAAAIAMSIFAVADSARAAPDQSTHSGTQSASQHFGGRNFDIPDPAHGGRGGEIYATRCASCHDEGLARAPHRLLFAYMSPQSIYRALTQGTMQSIAEGLSDGDRIAVAEFLTRRKMGDAKAAPEPPMCKGKAARFDFDDPTVFRSWGLTPGHTRFVPREVAGIDKSNIARLRLKWAVAFPNAVQVRSQPALAGGAVYVGSHNGGVYALDRESGCARWTFQAGSEVRTAISVSPWSAGDRSVKPRIYFGDVFGFVYALDAQTGRQVWRVRADGHPNVTITGAPTLHDGALYVPVSSLEGVRPADPNYECCTSRGAVVALDAATGEMRWKTYTTDTPKLLGTNAKGVKRYGPAGASIWSSPVIDDKRKQLYVGTGGNSVSPATNTSDAIIALDLTNGAIRWIYQGLAGDASNLACLSTDTTNCPAENGPDYDFGAGAMLVTLDDGRQMLLAGQKSGDVHAIDPDTGKPIWRQKPGRGGTLGGVHFSMAANQSTLFVPINDTPDTQHNGEPYKQPGRPGIYAYEIANGKLLWSALPNSAGCSGLKGCTVGYSQAITATDDLVWAGANDGWLRAFDAQSGAIVWQVDTKRAIKTVTGELKTGGAFGGGAGPVLHRGMLIASSGYNRAGMTSNLLLVFEVE